jgi:hypothetical protein
MMDNLEPLEPLPGLVPEQGLEDAAAWDSDDDELVSFVVQELEDIIFDDEYRRQHGGSTVGRQPNLYRDFDANLARIVKQYFGTSETPPLYPESSFIRRYRLPRQVFDRLFEKLSVLPDFLRKPDALGNMGIHPLQRITGALRVLGYC